MTTLRQQLKSANIELSSTGFATFSEFTSLEQFQQLSDVVRKEEKEIVLSNVLTLLHHLDNQYSGVHNYYGYAINLIRSEFNDE